MTAVLCIDASMMKRLVESHVAPAAFLRAPERMVLHISPGSWCRCAAVFGGIGRLRGGALSTNSWWTLLMLVGPMVAIFASVHTLAAADR